MKKIFGFFAVLSALLLGLSACQKEVEQIEKPAVTHTLKFVAEVPLTKTTADIDNVNKTVGYSWTKDDEDRFEVYEINGETYKKAKEVTGNLKEDGTMTLLANFDGSAVTGARYIALFNTGVKAEQTATGTTYDQLSDVLISKPVQSSDIENEELQLQFKRETAFALMTAKGLTDGANIIGASLTSNQILAAEYDIEEEAFKEEGATKTISISNNGGAVSAISNGDGNVFFATAPITDAHITVGVVTGDAEGKFVAAYEKKIADDRSISFENGNVRPFNIGMNKVTEQILDLSKDETTTATTEELSWDRTFVIVVAAKAKASTPANNYYPGISGKSYTNTRFYKNSTLTFTPKLGLSIEEIIYEATTDEYMSAIINSSWTNATASAAGKTVTIIPTDGTKAVSATIGATTGTTSITIKYGIPVQPTPHSVTVDPNIENGTVTANPSSNVMPGTEVTLTATPDDNYVFASWNVTAGDEEITVTDNKFSMPNADVIVRATFEEKQGDEVETSFVFDTDAGLEALGITKPGNSAGTNLGNKTYVSDAIEMKATDGGTATRVWNSSGVTSLRVYKNGGSLTFSGATISKIVFTGSSLTKQTADTGSYSDGTWTGSASSVKFTASDGVTIKTITVTYVGGGPVVTKYDVNCSTVDGGTLSANPSRAAEGAEVTLTATPADEEWSFNNNWSVVDAESNPVDVVSGKFTMPASNVTVTGSFTKKTYTIKRGTAEHGTFTINGTADDNQTAHKGDKISVAAEAESGYEHTGWTITKDIEGTVTVYNGQFTMPNDNVTVTPVFEETASIPEYASLADLVAAGKPTATEKTVKVTLTNEVITERNNSYICVKSGTQVVKLYRSGVPDNWEVGGTVSGTLQCPWLLYNNTDWELKPNAWTGLTYNAPLKPCSTPVISFTDGKASITSTEGATIMYAINTDENTQPELTSTYSGAFSVADGDVVWAQATKDDCLDSEVAHSKYTAGGGDPKVYTYTFNSKTWGATVSVDGGTETAANWTCGKEGGQLTSGQGIQVTSSLSGANGTSPASFTNVSKIVIRYCTNASKGAGTIKVQVGSGTEQSFSVTKPSSSGTTLKDAEFTFSPTEAGNVKITVECSANSVYVYSVAITAN